MTSTATDREATPGDLLKPVVIAVAGAKGGTGKTTFATSLACVAAEGGQTVTYVDCDVEEPDGHLFLHPELEEPVSASAYVPVVDSEACTLCGACTQICQFGAIATLGGKVLSFPNLCHGCGGCEAVCPVHAITEGSREIGVVQSGHAQGVRFVHGILKVGEASSSPLIRKVKDHVATEGLTIIDCPPGTACPSVQAVLGADFVLLVTEPTRFGLHDLKLAVATMRSLNLAFAVAINRSDIGDDKTGAYCLEQKIEILMQIPEDRLIAEAYSRGEVVVDACPQYKGAFVALLRALLEHVGHRKGAN